MTADVTHLRPPIEHYEPCTRETYGRAVMALMDGPADQITATNLRAWVRGFRQTTDCGCLKLRIKAAETAAVTANKRFEACLSEDNADRLASARAELARLRGMA